MERECCCTAWGGFLNAHRAPERSGKVLLGRWVLVLTCSWIEASLMPPDKHTGALRVSDSRCDLHLLIPCTRGDETDRSHWAGWWLSTLARREGAKRRGREDKPNACGWLRRQLPRELTRSKEKLGGLRILGKEKKIFWKVWNKRNLWKSGVMVTPFVYVVVCSLLPPL